MVQAVIQITTSPGLKHRLCQVGIHIFFAGCRKLIPPPPPPPPLSVATVQNRLYTHSQNRVLWTRR